MILLEKNNKPAKKELKVITVNPPTKREAENKKKELSLRMMRR